MKIHKRKTDGRSQSGSEIIITQNASDTIHSPLFLSLLMAGIALQLCFGACELQAVRSQILQPPLGSAWPLGCAHLRRAEQSSAQTHTACPQYRSLGSSWLVAECLRSEENGPGEFSCVPFAPICHIACR